MVLTSLLQLNPQKRPTSDKLIQFPFFRASLIAEYQDYFMNNEQRSTNRGERPSVPISNRVENRPSYAQSTIFFTFKNDNLFTVKGGRGKTSTERQSNGSWWKQDLYEEDEEQEETARDRRENIAHKEDFASPTFLQGQNEVQTFPEPQQTEEYSKTEEEDYSYEKEHIERVEYPPFQENRQSKLLGEHNSNTKSNRKSHMDQVTNKERVVI